MTINTRLIDLPTTIRGLCKKNSDGSFTILLNARLNLEQQQCTYLHEIKHIENGDFDSLLSIDCLECIMQGRC